MGCCSNASRSAAAAKYIENARQALLEHCEFLRDYLALANDHTNYFLTHSYWDRIHPSIAAQLDGKTADEMRRLFCAAESESPTEDSGGGGGDKATAANPWVYASDDGAPTAAGRPATQHPADLELFAPTVWRHSSVQTFARAAAPSRRDCRCRGRDEWRLTYDELCAHLGMPVRSEPTVRCFMGEKKAHEVEVMAALCSQLAAHQGVKHVIDVGSGRGYLPSALALQYGMSVLGIEGSPSTTASATKRLTMLEKQWRGLAKRQNINTAAAAAAGTEGDQGVGVEGSQDLPSFRSPVQAVCCGSFVAATEHIKDSDDLIRCSLKYFPVLQAQRGTCADADDSAGHAAADSPRTECGRSSPILLTALHACGSLTSHVLKLFSNSSEAGGDCRAKTDVRVMCCVGCCYHLLEEEFVVNPYSVGSDAPPEPPCFPMSALLRSKGCRLGRNARVLAAQSFERNFDPAEIRPLYWRALLQVILSDISGLQDKAWAVGKIARKHSTFVDYARQCLQKLKLDAQLSDVQLAAYEHRYAPYEQRMHAYILLRTVLSDVIENIIILDRLQFLAEQNIIKDVYVAQLFDPAISPRCMAIVAIKDTVPQRNS